MQLRKIRRFLPFALAEKKLTPTVIGAFIVTTSLIVCFTIPWGFIAGFFGIEIGLYFFFDGWTQRNRLAIMEMGAKGYDIIFTCPSCETWIKKDGNLGKIMKKWKYHCPYKCHQVIPIQGE